MFCICFSVAIVCSCHFVAKVCFSSCFFLFCFVLFGVFVCVKLPEVELLDRVCKAVCSNITRVGGGLGGQTWGI